MIYNLFLTLFFIIVLSYTCCKKEVIQLPHISQAKFEKTSFDKLNGFEKDDLKLAFKVFQKDCHKAIRYDNLKEICHKASETSNFENFFQNNFTPYALINDDLSDEGIITGYYEPILKGSYQQNETFKYPVYATPKNLLTIDLSSLYPELSKYILRGKVVGNKVIPYSPRENLEENEKEYLEPICYVDNKIDLFFMQIQGSGKVQLEDGSIINIGYAQQNGHPYYAIGRTLIENNFIAKEDISLQTIKQWLEENPEQIDAILNLNPSYVFFHQSDKTATGSLGVELVANRNLAVDRKFIPLGFPVFIQTTDPLDNSPIQQLMVAGDTGGAIKGQIRADFFFGNGENAKEKAGKMKQKGKLFLLIPNNSL
ncbi:MAG: MltA domain-containing protein [Campylobacterales bacterium]|nr:MltA domain-containing protein [Campylobacterales bacterium]